ncbi:eukaryotic translation initiation factor 5A-1 isoform X1 [Dama dama]|uniref:eukaryotic translation initiation factor 5A-1 isoform X1 n=1 Tax=Dama dama TaxID=30532 RepID=UPI002A36B99C|nr:eukaryotic translation initiation factor 5A-1 isoform X1 [Dama dama]
MGLREGRGGGRGERRPPQHGVPSASRARCGETWARDPVGARGDGWGWPGDVGATQGGGRRAARPPRGRGRRAATPGREPGARSARRGKGTCAVVNREPRGHVRWGRGLFGPGHRKPRAATWWAGAGNPQRGESWSSRAPEGAWNFEEWERPKARTRITSESPLWAYVTAPPTSWTFGAFPPALL